MGRYKNTFEKAAGVYLKIVDYSIDYVMLYSSNMTSSLYLLKELHYSRNVLNADNYSEQELLDQGYSSVEFSDAKFHQHNTKSGEANRKYVIPNRYTGAWFSSEMVFFGDGSLNNTSEDIGTFNIYSGNNKFLKYVVHGIYDVAPYMLWGNTKDDSTTVFDRIGDVFR